MWNRLRCFLLSVAAPDVPGWAEMKFLNAPNAYFSEWQRDRRADARTAALTVATAAAAFQLLNGEFKQFA